MMSCDGEKKEVFARVQKNKKKNKTLINKTEGDRMKKKMNRR